MGIVIDRFICSTFPRRSHPARLLLPPSKQSLFSQKKIQNIFRVGPRIKYIRVMYITYFIAISYKMWYFLFRRKIQRVPKITAPNCEPPLPKVAQEAKSQKKASKGAERTKKSLKG